MLVPDARPQIAGCVATPSVPNDASHAKGDCWTLPLTLQLLYHLLPLLFPHDLELLLLFRIQDRRDFRVDRATHRLQLLCLLQWTERGVTLDRLELRGLLLQDGC